MITVTNFAELPELNGNRIIVNSEKSTMVSSTVTINGTGNILVIEDGIKLLHSTIKFKGNNSVVYLKSNVHPVTVDIDANFNNTVFVGGGNYYNGILHMSASEEKNVIVGGGSLFSFHVWIRTADPHLIYDCGTHKRLNPSKSVFLGDHVWIGQAAMILKGSKIGSGSIIGASSVVTGKTVPSNVSFAGNPAKLIKSGVFFTGEAVHGWTAADAAVHHVFEENTWIYNRDENTVDIDELDKTLTACTTADERLTLVKSALIDTNGKNRFFIPLPEAQPQKKKSWFGK